jgi:hypothetical protein
LNCRAQFAIRFPPQIIRIAGVHRSLELDNPFARCRIKFALCFDVTLASDNGDCSRIVDPPSRYRSTCRPARVDKGDSGTHEEEICRRRRRRLHESWSVPALS